MRLYKFIPLIFVFVIFFSFSGCDTNSVAHTFSFVPEEITKEVDSTFNVFDIEYETNFEDKNIEDIVSNSKFSISSSNENIVSISNANITALKEGSTEISVVINFNNEILTASFKLTVVNKSQSEIPPQDNPPEETPDDEENLDGDETPDNENDNDENLDEDNSDENGSTEDSTESDSEEENPEEQNPEEGNPDENNQDDDNLEDNDQDENNSDENNSEEDNNENQDENNNSDNSDEDNENGENGDDDNQDDGNLEDNNQDEDNSDENDNENQDNNGEDNEDDENSNNNSQDSAIVINYTLEEPDVFEDEDGNAIVFYSLRLSMSNNEQPYINVDYTLEIISGDVLDDESSFEANIISICACSTEPVVLEITSVEDSTVTLTITLEIN